MASTQATPMLAERVDIHKSCKSLETLLNLLNDYCEAAGAIAILQKRLSKALKEAASLKTTGNVAGNALSASANVFETLSDVDSKFAKLADKEYDSISAEVKKWFKKLSKEEKAHDDRIASVNMKIKQAGQIYEKKSKKNPRDALEEHTRYMNLLATLGPEISQDKYNHALLVTERHTMTTFSVAACVARVADAEWLKSCEEVRRVSPAIGQVGEWRALCEGGWNGPIPRDLPGPEETQQLRDIAGAKLGDGNQYNETPTRNVEASGDSGDQHNSESPYLPGQRDLKPPSSAQGSPRPEFATDQSSRSPSYEGRTLSAVPSSYDRSNVNSEANTDSVRSLSAFPSPPTNIPIPPMSAPGGSWQTPTQLTARYSFPHLPRLTESPPAIEKEAPVEDKTELRNIPPSEEKQSSPSDADSILPQQMTGLDREGESLVRVSSPQNEVRRPLPNRPLAFGLVLESEQPARSGSAPKSPADIVRASTREDISMDRRSGSGDKPSSSGAMSGKPQGLERTDTRGSNGSIVAAMRHRYTNSTGTSPQAAPKEVPRLPLNVTDLATRYEQGDRPLSPRTLTSSPILRRPPLSTLDSVAQTHISDPTLQETRRDHRSSPDVAPPPLYNKPTAEATRELQIKEQNLRAREREIEQKELNLEQERAQLMNSRDNGYPNGPQLQPRPRTSSQQQRPRSQVDPTAASTSSLGMGRPQSHYSYSSTHLVPPGGGQHPQQPAYTRSHTSYSPSLSPSSSQHNSEHADNCGCDSCSVAKYKARNAAPSPHDLRPPEAPIVLRPEKDKSEKPRGWIRRLSMPVGNAFSSDTKKNLAYAKGVGVFSLDGRKNASTTTLRNAAAGAQEDGRMYAGMRRSYDVSGISNRSMTNLGLGKR